MAITYETDERKIMYTSDEPLMYTYFSKPKQLNMFATEKEVEENFSRHHNKIITKKSNYFVKNSNQSYLCFDNHMYLPIDIPDSLKVITLKRLVFRYTNNTTTKMALKKNLNDSYKTFKIPKHSGGFREIDAPNDELKAIQKNIAKFITNKLKYLPSNNAYGFTKNRNCKLAMEQHQKNDSKYFLKLDIHDFFNSTTKEIILREMNKHWCFAILPYHLKDFWLILCTKENVLPQGSPASPVFANIVLHEFDLWLDENLKKLDKDMVYTRYADDLLISSKNKFHQNIKEIVDNISAKLKDYNLTLSEHKTRYGTNAGRNWNLGIMYNKDNNLTVGYRQKKLFKNILHNAETGKIEVTEEFKNKLQGQLAYAAYIEPEYFAPFVERVRNL